MQANASTGAGRVAPSPATDTNAPATPAVSPRAVRRPPLLGIIVFCGGFASLGAELATSRLVAPYFGSSTFIWATIIGITLAFLSFGYWIGGRVADRRPTPVVLYSVTAAAAVLIGLIPVVARPILLSSLGAFARYDVGAFYGALVGVLLLMALPVTLLGFVTPYAIRLDVRDVGSAGNTAGSIYALSTLGSIAGSFLPVLLLIPTLGTTRTYLVLALALLLPSIVGLLLVRSVVPAAAALLIGLLVPAAAAAAPAGMRPAERGVLLDERDSAYNYIQVVQEDGANLLILNEGHAVHSVYHPERLLTGGPWDAMMLGPLVVDGFVPADVERVMVIGLAGGSSARQMSDPRVFGPIPIDGVEIDPEIVDVAYQWFGLGNLPNVNVIVEDGRYALRTSRHAYDLVAIDAYRQPYIPFQLTSVEFFEEVAGHLTPDGAAVVNVGRTVTDYRLVDSIASTMRAAFDHVYAIDVDGYLNTIVIGTNAPSSLANIAGSAELFAPDSPMREAAARVPLGNPRVVEPGPVVFTDDHAPVEQVVDSIILDAAREVTGS